MISGYTYTAFAALHRIAHKKKAIPTDSFFGFQTMYKYHYEISVEDLAQYAEDDLARTLSVGKYIYSQSHPTGLHTTSECLLDDARGRTWLTTRKQTTFTSLSSLSTTT
jgi:hypothetical protein